MSVLIKDMEKPKYCYAVINGESEYCPFLNTDDDCVLQLKKGICERTWAGQYSKCPLVETPEPREDAVSRQAIIKTLNEMDRYVSEELRLCDTDKKFPKNEVFIVDDVYEKIVENLPSAQPEHNPDDERKIADLHKMVNYLLSRLEQPYREEGDE